MTIAHVAPFVRRLSPALSHQRAGPRRPLSRPGTYLTRGSRATHASGAGLHMPQESLSSGSIVTEHSPTNDRPKPNRRRGCRTTRWRRSRDVCRSRVRKQLRATTPKWPTVDQPGTCRHAATAPTTDPSTQEQCDRDVAVGIVGVGTSCTTDAISSLRLNIVRRGGSDRQSAIGARRLRLHARSARALRSWSPAPRRWTPERRRAERGTRQAIDAPRLSWQSALGGARSDSRHRVCATIHESRRLTRLIVASVLRAAASVG
jgi:hypothetical protein